MVGSVVDVSAAAPVVFAVWADFEGRVLEVWVALEGGNDRDDALEVVVKLLRVDFREAWSACVRCGGRSMVLLVTMVPMVPRGGRKYLDHLAACGREEREQQGSNYLQVRVCVLLGLLQRPGIRLWLRLLGRWIRLAGRSGRHRFRLAVVESVSWKGAGIGRASTEEPSCSADDELHLEYARSRAGGLCLLEVLMVLVTDAMTRPDVIAGRGAVVSYRSRLALPPPKAAAVASFYLSAAVHPDRSHQVAAAALPRARSLGLTDWDLPQL